MTRLWIAFRRNLRAGDQGKGGDMDERRSKIERAAYNTNGHLNWRVVNVEGSTWRKCYCVSWIDHWREYSGGTRQSCSRLGCTNPAQVGAHVRIDDYRTSRNIYIVPLCKACNHWRNGESMFIDRRTHLVPGNVALTCAAW